MIAETRDCAVYCSRRPARQTGGEDVQNDLRPRSERTFQRHGAGSAVLSSSDRPAGKGRGRGASVGEGKGGSPSLALS